MNLRLIWRFLARAQQAGPLRPLLFALVLAVAALSAVGFFGERLRLALDVEASRWLGADLVVVGDHPLPEAYAAEARRRGLALAESLAFPSMVEAGGAVRLASVKAVHGGYPLRGELRIAQRPEESGTPAVGGPAPGTVWIEPRLAVELGIAPGSELRLGQKNLRVAAYLVQEPDRGLGFLALAPRLVVQRADLEGSGLLQPGARLTYRLFLAGDSRMIGDFADWLEKRRAPGEKLEQGGRQEMQNVLDRARRFAGLASLFTVVLAGVALSMAAWRYVAGQHLPVALLRCLGARRVTLARLYLGQFLLIGLAGSLLGVLLGYGVHLGLLCSVAALIGPDLPAPGWRPAGIGVLLGLLLLATCVLPPLWGLWRVLPMQVIRPATGAVPRADGRAAGLFGLLLCGLVFHFAEDARLGGLGLLVFVLAFLVFFLLARALIWLLARGRNASFTWRYGLAQLERHARATSLQVVTLALGGMVLLLLGVVRGEVLAAWQHSVPADAPNRFILNIQPEQRAALAAALADAGWPAEFAPMVRGRLQAINERPVRAADYPDDERAQHLVEREFNLSWRADLPTGNRIVAGRWFAPGEAGQPLASVEAGLARTLGIQVGDRLKFEVAGEPVAVTVQSLRALDWDSMRINFFVLLPPAVIDHLPASHLANFHLPAGADGRLDAILRRFPNLTVIDVSGVLAELETAIERVSQAVEMIFALTLVAGLLVLHGGFAALFAERRRSLAILRALGARRAQLRRALALEFATLGGLAGLLAGLGAVLAGALLCRQLFELTVVPALWLLPVSTLGGALLALSVTAFGLEKLVTVPPFTVLREPD